jgi:hypothetical protein
LTDLPDGGIRAGREAAPRHQGRVIPLLERGLRPAVERARVYQTPTRAPHFPSTCSPALLGLTVNATQLYAVDSLAMMRQDGLAHAKHGDSRTFQAKATARHRLRADDFVFRLSVKNYNDLRRDVRTPRLLIVVLLPTSEEEWLVHSEEELQLRHCGYWFSLAGWPPTTNAATISVNIPRTQVFDTAQLRALMGRANREEPL